MNQVGREKSIDRAINDWQAVLGQPFRIGQQRWLIKPCAIAEAASSAANHEQERDSLVAISTLASADVEMRLGDLLELFDKDEIERGVAATLMATNKNQSNQIICSSV